MRNQGKKEKKIWNIFVGSTKEIVGFDLRSTPLQTKKKYIKKKNYFIRFYKKFGGSLKFQTDENIFKPMINNRGLIILIGGFLLTTVSFLETDEKLKTNSGI